MLTQLEVDKLCELVEYLTDRGFVDMVDASAEISFMEYGMLRNPTTEQVIYCMPGDGCYNGIILDWSIVSLEDVKEYLEEDATAGYYSFIGSSKKKELNQLNNNYLAGVIQGINQYDGHFQQSCLWNLDTESIKRVLDNQ